MECLFPDIIFTLLGHKSTVLQYIADNDSNFGDQEFMVVKTEDRVLLKRFLNLAEEYKKLRDLTVNYSKSESNDEVPEKTEGLYYKAFLEGMCMALHPYRNCMVEIEKDLKNQKENKCLLAETLRKVEAYKPLIITVNKIVEQIEFSHLHGGQILNLMYEIIIMKFMDDKVQLSLIFKQCLQVILKEIYSYVFKQYT